MKKIMKIGLLTSLLFSCTDVVDTQQETGEPGKASVNVNLKNVGSLGKTRSINLNKLFITLEADEESVIYDTFELDGNGTQSISSNYELASLKNWTLTAVSKDSNDSTVHRGEESFLVEPKKTTPVKLDLSSNFSMLVANYFPIRDSVTRCELLLDNNVVGTSSFPKQSMLGDTVSLNYDYMSSSLAGESHHIKLDVFGEMWGDDTLLYSGDTAVSVISGQNTAYDVTLKWVGPGLPPLGQAEIQVVLGSIGTTKINGEIEDTLENKVPSKIIQLTNNSISESSVMLSGSNAVWSAYDGNDDEIFFYDGASIKQITNNTYNDQNPFISDSKFSWIGFDGEGWEIFFGDGSDVTQITNVSEQENSSCRIHNDKLVWIGREPYNGNQGRVFYFDGSSSHLLSDNAYNNYSPQISEDLIAWVGKGSNENEIFIYDGVTTSKIPNADVYNLKIGLSGSNIAWCQTDGNDYEIYRYDGSIVTQVSNNNYHDYNPVISGENMAWTAYINGGSGECQEVFYYDGDTTKQLTNNNTRDYMVQISGKNAVWVGNDGNDDEIFFYDGSLITQITFNNYDDKSPQISGSNIIWIGYDGTDNEVFLATP